MEFAPQFPRDVWRTNGDFVCETISINCGVTVWNDFVPMHDMTLVTFLNAKSQHIQYIIFKKILHFFIIV